MTGYGLVLGLFFLACNITLRGKVGVGGGVCLVGEACWADSLFHRHVSLKMSGICQFPGARQGAYISRTVK